MSANQHACITPQYSVAPLPTQNLDAARVLNGENPQTVSYLTSNHGRNDARRFTVYSLQSKRLRRLGKSYLSAGLVSTPSKKTPLIQACVRPTIIIVTVRAHLRTFAATRQRENRTAWRHVFFRTDRGPGSLYAGLPCQLNRAVWKLTYWRCGTGERLLTGPSDKSGRNYCLYTYTSSNDSRWNHSASQRLDEYDMMCLLCVCVCVSECLGAARKNGPGGTRETTIWEGSHSDVECGVRCARRIVSYR